MSRGYKTRQKAIRDEKRRLGPDGLEVGRRIPAKRFRQMQYEWRRALEGPYLGTLEQLFSKINYPTEET